MKKEGDRKICVECQIEIHVERKVDTMGERLSWRNPDGSAHFSLEDGQFVHTPTKYTTNDLRIMELEDRISRLERQIGIERVVE